MLLMVMEECRKGDLCELLYMDDLVLLITAVTKEVEAMFRHWKQAVEKRGYE